MSSPSPADTAEFVLPPRAPEIAPQTFSSLVQVDAAGLSDVGAVRVRNEDHFLIARLGRFFEPLQTNLSPNESPPRSEEIGYAVLVADGVGGSPAGEVASKFAIQTLINLALTAPDWILRFDEPAFVQEVIRRARSRFELVSLALREQGRTDPSLLGAATTLTMAISLGADLLLAHTGDSRAYLLRKNKLHQLTRDHTVAQRLADEGSIPSGAVATNRFRHVLTDALGSSRPIQIDVQRISLQDGDCLLLCSDGLTERLEEEAIARSIDRGLSAEKSCRDLLDQALNAGGRDNITIAMLRYRIP